LLAHKRAVFDHLVDRWRDLFNASFEVLLYDLTSTYFESEPPCEEDDKRRYGYSRDHRRDCVQVVIALIVTPEGFPLAYEVLPGNRPSRTSGRPGNPPELPPAPGAHRSAHLHRLPGLLPARHALALAARPCAGS
jgi:hypothetical protein